MEIYNVKTREDYDELMVKLEEKGYKWLSGKKPTSKNYWIVYKEKSCINISSKYITFMNIEQSKKQYPIIPIIEYKAKGENMAEEMKHKLQEVAKLYEVASDVSVAIETLARGTLAVEADLKEAKSSAKKLIEKIDEYLETLKPNFKVGDYVIEQNGNVISKIGEVLNGDFWGSYYKKINNYFSNSGGNILYKGIERLATPEEIVEYESALIFHKHGREPFELKKGDLIRTPSEKNTFVFNPENYTKEEFLDYGWEFIKTAEEVNEWLENK